MNATKDTPAEAPADPTRQAFRRYLIGCVTVVVILVAVRTIWTGPLVGPTRGPVERAFVGLMAGVSIVTAGSVLLMMFAPARARSWGLPAFTRGDERELQIATSAYSAAYLVGILSTLLYGALYDNMAGVALSLAMQVTFFVTVVLLNRKM